MGRAGVSVTNLASVAAPTHAAVGIDGCAVDTRPRLPAVPRRTHGRSGMNGGQLVHGGSCGLGPEAG